MKVYTVWEYVSAYESDTLIVICSSEEKALSFKNAVSDKDQRRIGSHDLDIEIPENDRN